MERVFSLLGETRLRSSVTLVLVSVTLLAAATVEVARAQATSLTNGDFETGDLSGWTTFTTTNGVAVINVVLFDTNNDSTATFSAQFSVGQVTFEGSDVPRGGGIFQNVNLTTGDLTITADIASDHPFNFCNGFGGLLQLLVDGAVVDTHDFGEICGPATKHSTLTANLLIDTAGAHEIRFLIMRAALRSGVTNYLDNVVLSGSATGPVIEVDIDIRDAKTKCGNDGKDYIRIGGQVEGLDPSADLTLEIHSNRAGTFGPFGPLTIPAGTRGPVEVDGGKVKVTLPKDGSGNFHINVDVNGLNDCTGDETEAELTLSLNGAVDTITLERKTDSKFHSKK